MSASFLLKIATLSENPNLVQDFGTAVRKSWLLPEGIWHLRIVKKSTEGAFLPYEFLDFRDQSKVSDPKRLFSLKTLIGKPPLSVLIIPAGKKRLVLRLDGKEAGGTDSFLAEVRRRKARILRELHLPFSAPTDQDEKKKLDWLKREDAITEEEHARLTSKLSV